MQSAKCRAQNGGSGRKSREEKELGHDGVAGKPGTVPGLPGAGRDPVQSRFSVRGMLRFGVVVSLIPVEGVALRRATDAGAFGESDERGALNRERMARTVMLAAHSRISTCVLYCTFRDSPKRSLTSVFSIHYSRFPRNTLPCSQGGSRRGLRLRNRLRFRLRLRPDSEPKFDLSNGRNFFTSFDATFGAPLSRSDGRSSCRRFGPSFRTRS